MLTPTGILELDTILHGGFPRGHSTVVTGEAGSGKTMLGMQFLASGAGIGELGLMVSFEESAENIISNFAGMAFPFASEIGQRVQILDGRPHLDTVAVGSFDLQGLIAILTQLVTESGARRIVLDATDALLAFDEDRRTVRREVTRLLQWIDTMDLTAIITIKTSSEQRLLGSYDFAEFEADGVIQLRSSMHGRLLQRNLRVSKLRGSNFVTGDHPYILGNSGIRVLYTPTRMEIPDNLSHERYSTGIERLDRMLEGGYLPGSITLLSGLAGTAKTTFGAAFLEAGCAIGQRGLFVGFDEPAEQLIANLRSVNIDLGPHRASGLLKMESFVAGNAIADQHLLTVEDLINTYQPQRIVIDPISAWSKSGGTNVSGDAVEQLVAKLKARGLTALLTAVSESAALNAENTPTRISTVADTWLHLNFNLIGGERNRTLTVVKSRGTGHSAQMREVLIDSHGVTLADVYVADGEVLVGTARYQREQSLRMEQLSKERLAARTLKELEDMRIAIGAKRDDLERDIQRIDEKRDSLKRDAAITTYVEETGSAETRSRRGADPKGDRQ